MRILYVILTCEKYLNTRVKWQKETWLKGQKYFYLSQPVGEETYNNAPKKYLYFLSNYIDQTESEFDWFFFCDDDTFVYTQRLNDFLLLENSRFEFMYGFKGGTFDIHNLKITWCSGGAGIVMSKELVKKIQDHLINTENPLITHETDITLAIWATMAAKDLTVIDNKRFRPFAPHDPENRDIKDAITYHYCNENDFIRLGREV